MGLLLAVVVMGSYRNGKKGIESFLFCCILGQTNAEKREICSLALLRESLNFVIMENKLALCLSSLDDLRALLSPSCLGGKVLDYDNLRLRI